MSRTVVNRRELITSTSNASATDIYSGCNLRGAGANADDGVTPEEETKLSLPFVFALFVVGVVVSAPFSALTLLLLLVLLVYFSLLDLLFDLS